MQKPVRVVFTEGGKGGVAKTEVAIALIEWYRSRGFRPTLFDFDIENTNKSGLQNFFPEALKFDVHTDGALDEFFEACGESECDIVVADLGAGSGTAAFEWFDQAFGDAEEMGIKFTAVGVTTNESGSVQSVLKWANHLQDKVDYLIVLNELLEPNSSFEYWHDEPAVARFCEAFSPTLMRMAARVQEFQAELRNQTVTLQQVIDGKVDTWFLRKMKNVVRAKRYQRELFTGFDDASSILLP